MKLIENKILDHWFFYNMVVKEVQFEIVPGLVSTHEKLLHIHRLRMDTRGSIFETTS